MNARGEAFKPQNAEAQSGQNVKNYHWNVPMTEKKQKIIIGMFR